MIDQIRGHEPGQGAFTALDAPHPRAPEAGLAQGQRNVCERGVPPLSHPDTPPPSASTAMGLSPSLSCRFWRV